MRPDLDKEPVYPCLSAPMVVFGVDWRMFAGNAMVLMLMAMMFKQFWWAVPALAAHLALMIATKRDPDMMGIYLAYAGQAARYEPQAVVDMHQGRRPNGLGRGALI
ncbi:MAG: VirB3 family type IV secretion system protein [Gallionellaceae bacterium]|nr:VirB3 family type IV secretion system protein [Gallionellaceae bacterium]